MFTVIPKKDNKAKTFSYTDKKGDLDGRTVALGSGGES